MKKIYFILLILILSACGIVDPSPSKNSQVGSADYQMVSVNELSQELKTKDFLFVNVHIPMEGNIPGTDLDIPYNKIEEEVDQFPVDKNAKIILYCRSGSMGNTAARTLAGLGYTNVFNLEGGYTAWEAAGNQFPEE